MSVYCTRQEPCDLWFSELNWQLLPVGDVRPAPRNTPLEQTCRSVDVQTRDTVPSPGAVVLVGRREADTLSGVISDGNGKDLMAFYSLCFTIRRRAPLATLSGLNPGRRPRKGKLKAEHEEHVP